MSKGKERLNELLTEYGASEDVREAITMVVEMFPNRMKDTYDDFLENDTLSDQQITEAIEDIHKDVKDYLEKFGGKETLEDKFSIYLDFLSDCFDHNIDANQRNFQVYDAYKHRLWRPYALEIAQHHNDEAVTEKLTNEFRDLFERSIPLAMECCQNISDIPYFVQYVKDDYKWSKPRYEAYKAEGRKSPDDYRQYLGIIELERHSEFIQREADKITDQALEILLDKDLFEKYTKDINGLPEKYVLADNPDSLLHKLLVIMVDDMEDELRTLHENGDTSREEEIRKVCNDAAPTIVKQAIANLSVTEAQMATERFLNRRNKIAEKALEIITDPNLRDIWENKGDLPPHLSTAQDPNSATYQVIKLMFTERVQLSLAIDLDRSELLETATQYAIKALDDKMMEQQQAKESAKKSDESLLKESAEMSKGIKSIVEEGRKSHSETVEDKRKGKEPNPPLIS